MIDARSARHARHGWQAWGFVGLVLVGCGRPQVGVPSTGTSAPSSTMMTAAEESSATLRDASPSPFVTLRARAQREAPGLTLWREGLLERDIVIGPVDRAACFRVFSLHDDVRLVTDADATAPADTAICLQPGGQLRVAGRVSSEYAVWATVARP